MKITDTKSLGALIRKRRKELHYTQAYLSEYTGFSISFISDLERGKVTAELGKAIYLINMLGMDINVEERGQAGICRQYIRKKSGGCMFLL